MKIIFLTGSHPRHAYIANEINKSGYLSGLIIEQREKHVPTAPKDLNTNLKLLFNLHFKKRHESEKNSLKKIIFKN